MERYKKDYIILNFPHNLIKSDIYFELMFPKSFKIFLDRSIIGSYVDRLITEYYSKNYILMDNTIKEIIKYQKQKIWIEEFNFYLTIQYYPKDKNDNLLNFYKRLDTYSFMKSNFTPWIISESDYLQLRDNYNRPFATNILRRIDFNYVREKTIENILNKNYISKEKEDIRVQMMIYLFMKLCEYYEKG